MADETITSDVETVEDFGKGPEGSVRRWLAEISAYDKEFSTWKDRCPKIIERFRDETPGGDVISREHGRFNILWSNIQTLQPALYSKLPKAQVFRRYKDRDPIGRAAAEILERALDFSIDSYDFNGTIKAARDDYLLCARGQAWVRYVPHKGKEIQDRIALTMDDTGSYRDTEGEVYEEVEEDEEGLFTLSEPYRPIEYEETVCEHINWADFGHSPAPSWSKVGAVWKKELLTREQLIERFGEKIGQEVTLEKSVKGVSEQNHEAFGDTFKRAEVYEIWDKDSMKAIWISPGYAEGPLDVLEDPLGLEDFFPCPRPLYGTVTTDKLVPVPDYAEYQAQAQELDKLTERIQVLTMALKVTGFYAGDKSDEIEGALRGNDNIMIPVANWAMVSERGGMDSLVSWFPIEQVATVLQGLVAMREQVKRDLYELTGMSDIIRGQGATTGVTATEQKIKGQYAALRLQDRKAAVDGFVRDSLRLKAEIIAEHFSPEVIAEISGWFQSPEAQSLNEAAQAAAAESEKLETQVQQVQQQIQAGQIRPEDVGPRPPPIQIPPNAQQVFDQAVKLLKDDRLRTFRIDIETDSTIIEDMEREKKEKTEFLQGIAAYLKEAVPAGKDIPALAPILGEILLFTVRGWKTGRQMETIIEQGLEKLRNAPPDPGPSEAEIAAQKEERDAQRQAQIEQARAAADAARAQVDGEKAKNDGLRLEIEKQEAQAASTYRQNEAMAAENERQRAHEVRQREFGIREKEAAIRLKELTEAQPIREDRKYALDRDKVQIDREKLEDEKRARKENREFETETALKEGRFVTESLEDEMKEVAEALLAIAAAMKEQGDKQDKKHEEMIKTMVAALTAPRVLERDAQGRAIGARVETIQ